MNILPFGQEQKVTGLAKIQLLIINCLCAKSDKGDTFFIAFPCYFFLRLYQRTLYVPKGLNMDNHG
ncbi:hypothetical protein D0T84_07370 [Dysgonomonas sp. 521]|nr:hypothetical protein [Dysgonomonas sp. 521]